MARDLICPACGKFGFKTTDVFVTGESASLKCVLCGEWSAQPKWKTVATLIAEVERLSRIKEENEKLKGECICGHDGKLTSADCPRHGTIELSLADHAKRAKNLFAEIDRLTKTNEINCRAMEILIGDLRDMFNVPEDKELMPVIEETISSLTRSKAEGRREGMEEAAKIAEDRLLYDRRGGHTGNAAGTASNIAAAIRQQAVQPTEEKADVCGWKAWDDESGCYDTGCGNVQYFSEGGVTDNRYKVCPYCGKNILVKA